MRQVTGDTRLGQPAGSIDGIGSLDDGLADNGLVDDGLVL